LNFLKLFLLLSPMSWAKTKSKPHRVGITNQYVREGRRAGTVPGGGRGERERKERRRREERERGERERIPKHAKAARRGAVRK
jgi:hypothetical protein